IEVLAPHTPGRTDAEVAELGRLVGGVPALHDVLEAFGPLVLAVALEPCFLDQPARRPGVPGIADTDRRNCTRRWCGGCARGWRAARARGATPRRAAGQRVAHLDAEIAQAFG